MRSAVSLCQAPFPTTGKSVPSTQGSGSHPPSDVAGDSSITRRAAVGGLGALAAAGVYAGRTEPAAAAAVGGLYIVVDAAGGGDYTTIEAAVAAVPANTTIFVKHGTYTVTNPPLNP